MQDTSMAQMVMWGLTGLGELYSIPFGLDGFSSWRLMFLNRFQFEIFEN